MGQDVNWGERDRQETCNWQERNGQQCRNRQGRIRPFHKHDVEEQDKVYDAPGGYASATERRNPRNGEKAGFPGCMLHRDLLN